MALKDYAVEKFNYLLRPLSYSNLNLPPYSVYTTSCTVMFFVNFGVAENL